MNSDEQQQQQQQVSGSASASVVSEGAINSLQGENQEQARAETTTTTDANNEETDQDEQDVDDNAGQHDEEEQAQKKTAAAVIIDTPRAPSRTLVGGLIASSKSMKPFRSPLSGRLSNHSSSTSSAATPSKSSSSSTGNLARSANTPFTPFTSSSTPSTTRRSSAASSAVALNKPFRSPVVPRANTKSTEHDAANTSEDAIPSNMTSFQLSTALPALERRLALLKNAKRLLAAREQNEDVADNTAHIRVLSEKWLAAGREAADMLYDLTKDAYDNLDNDERQKNGGSLSNNTSRRTNNGYQNQSNRWGWDTKNEEQEKQARIKAEMNAMDEEQREEYMESVEREEERNPLPDIGELTSKSYKKRSNAADSGNYDANERRKKARLEEQQRENHRKEADYESPPPEQPVEDEEEEVSDSEPIDDPLKRGMARMLTQTGIDIKTLGWDAVKEEWEPVIEASA